MTSRSARRLLVVQPLLIKLVENETCAENSDIISSEKEKTEFSGATGDAKCECPM